MRFAEREKTGRHYLSEDFISFVKSDKGTNAELGVDEEVLGVREHSWPSSRLEGSSRIRLMVPG